MARLTNRQRLLLERLTGVSPSGWACTYWCSAAVESTGAAYRNLRILQGRGLVERDASKGYWPLWRITDAGRAALAEPKTEAA